MSINRFLTLSLILLAGACLRAEKPNILWIVAEDTTPWMGCYGYEANVGHTPHFDSLASQGVLFKRAYVPAPVCSACRSAFMGGMSQIRFNAHEHRSSRGPAHIYLPKGMKLLSQILSDHGYTTFNLGKTDYNFTLDTDEIFTFSQNKGEPVPWDKIKASQPFYGQIQTAGGKNNTKNWPAERTTDRNAVTVPLDYPDNAVQRESVAQHCDAIRKDDDAIGRILDGLKEAGLWDNTIVAYFGDHGANHLLRHKQMPTEGGLHVPFMIMGPKKWIPSGIVRNDLVNILDLSATTLAWAGIPIPANWEGQNLFGEDFHPREYVAAAKDRLDHTIDRVRTIRTERYRYTRNFKTDRIFLQPQYRDNQPYTRNMHELYHAGKLSPRHAEIYFGERPSEEFYDVEKDPAQMVNLIDDPKLADEIQRHRELLASWIAKGDFGEGEESLEELHFQADDQNWGEGVNPEYELVRTDDDGDGLSSKWEKINGRDPNDGKLVFLFDNGGWQTEGWEADGHLPNIAGYLGYLDFNLPSGSAAIVRRNLNVSAANNANRLEMRARSSLPVKAWFSAVTDKGPTGRMGKPITINKGKEFTSYTFDLNDQSKWSGQIRELRIEFEGDPKAKIEIDSIVAD
ncbi:MAG: sulfatase [Verrucomicrobiae bacterium]|nr:sulfatase [Verrucomicrobiae bacterium]